MTKKKKANSVEPVVKNRRKRKCETVLGRKKTNKSKKKKKPKKVRRLE